MDTLSTSVVDGAAIIDSSRAFRGGSSLLCECCPVRRAVTVSSELTGHHRGRAPNAGRNASDRAADG